MRTKLPIILLFALFSGIALGQKKSELFAQIEELKSEKQELEQELASVKREVSSSKAKSETLKTENVSLREANATLLKNLTSFSELSKKSSENVNKTLAALQQKEKQLNGINEMIASNDSTAIVALTQVKKTLGENANANFSEGDIILSGSLNTLFGSDSSMELTDEGNEWLARVADIIKANPDRKTEVVGLNITGEFATTYDQAIAVTKRLTDSLGVTTEKLSTLVKDGNFKEGIAIKLRPNYEDFYGKVKESVKVAQ
ncbi:hypothetical protein [Flagellimonas meridianipacifica]|uniref:OmpA family protein n=1 Tax=Flagellimonas meridianipacifica TaxID=1080225 RepID=A0A2T0MB58_9FLAO|nr:hypothetical protein [Allomuricauda pacifica]PRX54729.1 hypothetical protein CLV81_3133 [Allomuricauda pacifica]